MFPERIETERLFLRRPEVTDAEEVFARYATDPEVTHYLTWRPHATVDDTVAYLRQRRDIDKVTQWLIYPLSGGPLLGSIGCSVDKHTVQFGYCFARYAWGHGYATEVATAMVRGWLDEPGVWRVQAFVDPTNTASARVLEKAGLALEGLLRKWIAAPNVSDIPCDALVYARVREA